MENLDSNVLDNTLQVNDTVRQSWLKQAYWAKITGIIWLAFCALFLILIVFGGGAVLFRESSGLNMAGIGIFIFLFYGAFILFFCYLAYLYFDHGRKMKTALETEDQEILEIGTSKMSRFVKIIGILSLIVIAFYVVVFLIMIAAGGTAMFGN